MTTEGFEYALFAYEDRSIPDELKLVGAIELEFKRQPLGSKCLVQHVASVDEAAERVQEFRARTCGSAYSIALINLNSFPSAEELSFLLGPTVLGDPWTLFLVTLRSLSGPIYSLAREKVEREATPIRRRDMPGAPSCIDSYTKRTRVETYQRIAAILEARLEADKRILSGRKTGRLVPFTISPMEALLRNSSTTFYGSAFASRSGMYASVDAPESVNGET